MFGALLFALVASSAGLKPKFDPPYEIRTLEDGSYEYLTCRADEGQTPITYKWYNQDLDEITKDDNETIYVDQREYNSFLTFNRARTEHEGPYTCTANNTHGLAKKVFFVRVISSSDNSAFRHAKVSKLTARSVTFNITSYGPVKYIDVRYRKDKTESDPTDMRLPSVPGNIYEIGNLFPGGSYIFRFRTVPSKSNDWSREYNITLLSEAPEIILNISRNQNVKLQWFTKTDGFSREALVKYQIIYFPIETVDGNSWKSSNCSGTIEVPACDTSFTIVGLKRGTVYQMEVRARTSTGYSEPWRQKINLM